MMKLLINVLIAEQRDRSLNGKMQKKVITEPKELIRIWRAENSAKSRIRVISYKLVLLGLGLF